MRISPCVAVFVLLLASGCSRPAVTSAPQQTKDEQPLSLRDVAKFGDLHVTIDRVYVDTIAVERRSTMEQYLAIRFTVHNKSKDRKYEYHSWGQARPSAMAAQLTDDRKNRYSLEMGTPALQPDGRIAAASVYPGRFFSDILVFQTPVNAAEKFRLRLPGEAVGEKGEAVFAFRRDDIENIIGE